MTSGESPRELLRDCNALSYSSTRIDEVNQRLELLPEVNDEGAVKA